MTTFSSTPALFHHFHALSTRHVTTPVECAVTAFPACHHTTHVAPFATHVTTRFILLPLPVTLSAPCSNHSQEGVPSAVVGRFGKVDQFFPVGLLLPV